MTIFNNQITISTGDLKKWGYLAETKAGYISWYKEVGGVIAEIKIYVDINADMPFMHLSYMHQGTTVEHTIDLVADPSNLGNGKVWYFICPISGERARKLYYIEGRFVHRNACKGSLYLSQTLSHKGLKLHKLFEVAFAEEKINEKHFTPYYKGLPTARYKSIMKKVRKAEGLDMNELLL
ncbi:MAG: hypothetical protein KQH67_13060 [Bacteroidetes bacterium]|nr:hypothetical protein [Bacteroidota bacterium]